MSQQDRRRSKTIKRMYDPVATRRRMLEAGLALLSAQPAGNVLSHIKAPVVASRAGLTAGAFFHHWSTQAQYVHDLFAYALLLERQRSLAQNGHHQGPLASATTVRDALAAVTETTMDLAANPMFDVHLALWACHGKDPLAAKILRDHLDLTGAMYTAGLDDVLANSGVELNGRFTGAELAIVVDSIITGVAMRYAYDPVGTPAHLASDAVRALVTSSTRPRPASAAPPLGERRLVEPQDAPAPSGFELDVTRMRLLDAGVELLSVQPAGNVLSHVKAPLVVAAAGLTVGAFYYHWSTQSQFVRDLVVYALDADRYRQNSTLRLNLADNVNSRLDLEDLLGRAAKTELVELSDSPFFAVQVLLRASLRNDPTLSPLLTEIDRRISADTTSHLERLFAEAKVEPVAPQTVASITVMLAAIGEGLAVRRAVDPNAESEDMYSRSVMAIFPQVVGSR